MVENKILWSIKGEDKIEKNLKRVQGLTNIKFSFYIEASGALCHTSLVLEVIFQIS